MVSKIYSTKAQQDEFLASKKPLFSKMSNNEVYPEEKFEHSKKKVSRIKMIDLTPSLLFNFKN